MADNQKKKEELQASLLKETPTVVDRAFESMFKAFKNKVAKEGVIAEVNMRRYYRKPSEIKREEVKKILRRKELEKGKQKK